MAAVEVTATIPEWTTGDRLRKAREHRQMQQSEMADALKAHGVKCSRTTVGAWEADISAPRRFMPTIEAWSEITGVPVAWLLGVQNWKLLSVPSPAGQLELALGADRPNLAAV